MNGNNKKLSQKIGEWIGTTIGIVLSVGFIAIVLAAIIKSVQFILF